MRRRKGQQVPTLVAGILLAALFMLQGAAMAGAQSTSSPTNSTSSAAAPDADTATGPTSDAPGTQDGSSPTATTVRTSAPTRAPTAARTATNAPTAAKSSSAPAPPPLSFKDAIAAEYNGHRNVSWVAAIVIVVVIALGITGCCVIIRRRKRARAARFVTLRDQELAFKSDAFDI